MQENFSDKGVGRILEVVGDEDTGWMYLVEWENGEQTLETESQLDEAPKVDQS